MEVTVAPEDPVEIRRIHLHNNTTPPPPAPDLLWRSHPSPQAPILATRLSTSCSSKANSCQSWTCRSLSAARARQRNPGLPRAHAGGTARGIEQADGREGSPCATKPTAIALSAAGGLCNPAALFTNLSHRYERRHARPDLCLRPGSGALSPRNRRTGFPDLCRGEPQCHYQPGHALSQLGTGAYWAFLQANFRPCKPGWAGRVFIPRP